MGLLYEFCRRLSLYAVVGKLHAVIDSLEVFIDQQGRVNWLVHSLIVRFEVCGCDLPISTKKMPEKISAHDSKESGVPILQLPEVHVFEGIYDFIPVIFIHCALIIVDYLSFVVPELDTGSI